MSTGFPVAALLASLYLPVPFIMLWLHAFHRRCGVARPRWYALHGIVYAALVAGSAALAPLWPVGAWPFPPGVRATGVVMVGAAILLLAGTYRAIDGWTAMAGPQTTGTPGRALITRGVYAHIRHPRYTVLIAGSLGNFLSTGAPLLLAAFVLTTVLTLFVVLVEEQELIRYFGDAYRAYRREVPALFPVRGKRHARFDRVTT